jgi:hypothetical protein
MYFDRPFRVLSVAVVVLLSACTSTSPSLNFDSIEPLRDPTRDPLLVAPDADLVPDSDIDTGEVADQPADIPASATRFDAPTVGTLFAPLVDKWVRCFHQPERCDPDDVVAADSPEEKRLRESIAYYTAERLRTKPDEGSLTWRIESFTIVDESTLRMTTCEHDTRIFFDTSFAETELGDIIIDATVWTRRVEWTLRRNRDDWQLWSRRIERRSPAERFCAV